MFPGPILNATANDIIVVNIFNNLPEPFLMTWYIFSTFCFGLILGIIVIKPLCKLKEWIAIAEELVARWSSRDKLSHTTGDKLDVPFSGEGSNWKLLLFSDPSTSESCRRIRCY